MSLKKTIVSVIICVWMYMPDSISQCTGGTNGGAIAPAPTSTYQTMSVSDGTYYTFDVATAGCDSYVFTFCSNGGSASFDTQITILDNSGSPVAGGYNDDFCSLQSQVTWTPTTTGTYRILIMTYNCSNSGNSGTLAYIKNSSLSPSGDYSLAGDATSPSPYECVQLTANTAGQTGCAWDANSTLDFNSSFSYDFTVNLGSNDGGADGLAFVIQNDPAGICACGGSGGGFAASGISNSLIVEIDTYLNTEDRDDGTNMYNQGVLCSGGSEPDHLDIWLNGTVNPPGTICNTSPGARIIPTAEPLLNSGVLYNIENGLDHILRISWTPGSPGTFTASVLDQALSTIYSSVSYSFDPATLFGTTSPYFGFTAATGGLSNEQTFCNPAILLPAEMTSFDINCTNNGPVLNWVTAVEVDLDHFVILRSEDGQKFKDIGSVNARGGQTNTSYSFIDPNPAIGTVYYTIKEVDNNGESKLCGFVRVVKCETDNLAIIYPNPATSNEVITLYLNNQTSTEIKVVNMTGQVVYSKHLNEGNEHLLYPELSSGMYQLLVYNEWGSITQSQRFLVTN
ncbi:MAG: T9SS type A sorting domain-containing protein [Crocinitomicaceae bacterium]|nr:T9SS type A sorting domain-containing protein [Crocinitomicaceae bacterium]